MEAIDIIKLGVKDLEKMNHEYGAERIAGQRAHDAGERGREGQRVPGRAVEAEDAVRERAGVEFGTAARVEDGERAHGVGRARQYAYKKH